MLTLDRVLDGLVVDVQPFALCEVRGDGQLEMDCQDRATLHYVISGEGVFRISGWPDVSARAGTVLIVPPTATHRLRAFGGEKKFMPHCRPLDRDWAVRRAGQGPSGILVACGRVKASYQDVDGLFDYLYEPLVADLTKQASLRSAMEQILNELASPKPGTRALVRALMQQCMILLLRDHCLGGHSRISWMEAALDERLWATVRTIFAKPEAPHTLESLADGAGMSRSAFAERFKSAFGRGPNDLVRELRLVRGAQLLVASEAPVKTIAEKVGYESRSYFTRAFRTAYGVSPAAYRASQNDAVHS
ncbi:MAG: AraC family transcriptional regulator [Alphaproteobacteria bacterium]|nr:AraC family transcriptional regulator [Alphaproteobacteria bacterium]